MNGRVEPVASLRDYFRDLDRVAPADGQLMEVLTRTADLRQRPGWQTRLPRVAGPETLGRQFPLRYALLAVALLLIALAISVGGGRARGPFEGRWSSTDTDGSTQFLEVTAGSAPHLRYEDLMASGCRDHGDDSLDFLAVGTGAVVGDQLTAGFPDGGGCHTWRVPAYEVTFALDRATGTMIDGTGVVWHRLP
jgi:hypothetical protein